MPARLDAASLRLDYFHSPRVTVFGRYNEAPSEFTVPEEWNAATRKLHTDRTRTITGGLHAALSTRLHNELRVNYSSDARVESTSIGALDGAMPLDAIGRPGGARIDLLGALLQHRGARPPRRRTRRARAAGQYRGPPDRDRRRTSDQVWRRHQAHGAAAVRQRLQSGAALQHGSADRERRRGGRVHRGAGAALAADAELLGVRAGHVARHARPHADVRRALGREPGAVRQRGPPPVRAARPGRPGDRARHAAARRRVALSHALVELRAAGGRVVSAWRAAARLGHGAARRRGRLLRSRQRRDAVGVRPEPAVRVERAALERALSTLGRGRGGAAADAGAGRALSITAIDPELRLPYAAVERRGRAIAWPASDPDGHLRRRGGTESAAAPVLRAVPGPALDRRRVDHERWHVRRIGRCR